MLEKERLAQHMAALLLEEAEGGADTRVGTHGGKVGSRERKMGGRTGRYGAGTKSKPKSK